MGGDTLCEVQEAGVECASYAVSLPHLPHLTANQLRQALAASRRAIEDKRGVPVRSLAYPYGETNRLIERAAA